MVYLATETQPLPTKDLLSWIFDEKRYDQEIPVAISKLLINDLLKIAYRFMLMLPTPSGQYPTIKLVRLFDSW